MDKRFPCSEWIVYVDSFEHVSKCYFLKKIRFRSVGRGNLRRNSVWEATISTCYAVRDKLLSVSVLPVRTFVHIWLSVWSKQQLELELKLICTVIAPNLNCESFQPNRCKNWFWNEFRDQHEPYFLGFTTRLWQRLKTSCV